MVTAEDVDEGRVQRFILRPDFGGHWRQSLRIFQLIAAVSLGIAGCFALLGFWPVLPFAGLEVTALGWALYVSARRALDAEVVTVGETWVCVEKGRGRPERQWSFDRYFAEVCLIESAGSLEPPQVVLRHGRQRVELGSFLREAERKRLARRLRQCIGAVASTGVRPAA